jgi:biopolymer transport protein ExbB
MNLMELIRLHLDHSIIGVLGVMSFMVIWFAVERFLFLRRVRVASYDHEETLKVALTRHLTVLSSIGSNAPYIGLLGTVFGIMLTFHDVGQAGAIDTHAIMLGLALALKATAMGLFVAIPAIIFYTALLRRVDVLLAQWKQLHASQTI